MRRAETRDEGPTMAGDELLSAFKVASFAAFDEDEPSPANVAADDESKDWDEIIPERLRKKVEDEEKSKEIEDLYLPPRHRVSVQQANHSDSDGEGSRRKKKERRDGTGGSSGEEETDDEKPKKRGRPPLANRERIKNFTDVEVSNQIFFQTLVPHGLIHLDKKICKELQKIQRAFETFGSGCV